MLIVGGRLSDRWGRRASLIGGSVLMTVLVWPSFMLLTSGNLAGALAGQVLLAVPLCLYGGASYTFFVEIFLTATRLTGAAISYDLSIALFGGTGRGGRRARRGRRVDCPSFPAVPARSGSRGARRLVRCEFVAGRSLR